MREECKERAISPGQARRKVHKVTTEQEGTLEMRRKESGQTLDGHTRDSQGKGAGARSSQHAAANYGMKGPQGDAGTP